MADEYTRRILEADLRKRPTATLSQRCEYLRSVAGLRLSESTVSRLFRRMGWTRKKTGGSERTRRVLEGGLGDAHCWKYRRRAVGVRGRDGLEHLAGPSACLGATWRESALLCGTQLRQEHDDAPSEHDKRRDGSVCGRGGKHNRWGVRGLRRAGPRPGAASRASGSVTDNLAAHKSERVRNLIEGRGCELCCFCRPTDQT
jgi:Winged helix-turn helix